MQINAITGCSLKLDDNYDFKLKHVESFSMFP